MLISTPAIVFRNTKYSETSVIVKVYTRELGLTSLIINGVRKLKSSHHASLLQPMSLVNIVMYYRAGKDLNRIKEISPDHLFESVPFDIVKSSIAIFLSELCFKCIKEEEGNEVLFDFLHKRMKLLDAAEQGLDLFPQVFMLDLSMYLGFYPGGKFEESRPYYRIGEGRYVAHGSQDERQFDPSQSRLFSRFVQAREMSEGFSFRKAERQELLNLLLRYYRYHIENFATLKSVEVIRVVFS